MCRSTSQGMVAVPVVCLEDVAHFFDNDRKISIHRLSTTDMTMITGQLIKCGLLVSLPWNGATRRGTKTRKIKHYIPAH
jgi:hypothetical protein